MSARLLSWFAVCAMLMACAAPLPKAIDYEIKHQRALARAVMPPVNGYYEYQKFTQSN